MLKPSNPSTTGGRTVGVSVGGDRVAVVMEDRNTYILDLNLNVIATIAMLEV
ncbi:hypothetical protein ACNA06_09000 [Lysinibacillus sp. RSDA_15]|uniref:hypothetical protein n=1 Tax=Lysinibacillus sp. RSDA_15 TaxID=3391421 RepID=UPI003A4DF62B